MKNQFKMCFGLLRALFLFLLAPVWVQAQTCVCDELHEEQLALRPDLIVKQQKIDAAWAKHVTIKQADGTQYKSIDGVYTIPVVFHLVKYPGDPAGDFADISDEQVLGQLDALNQMFGDPWSYAGQPDGGSEGMNIHFCLAQKDPDGEPTSGILRHTNVYTVHFASDLTARLNLTEAAYPPEAYLNVWVVKSILGGSGNVLGYAQYPGGAKGTDMIMIQYDAFGVGVDQYDLLSDYAEGDVLVHEVGHWLGLRHTFHGGCAGMTTNSCALLGDRVCDTPPVAQPNFNCPAGDSCAEDNNLPDQIENYMDYGEDACSSTFTAGQRDRMHFFLDNERSWLHSDANLLFTGVDCIPAPESAIFLVEPEPLYTSQTFTARAAYPPGPNVSYTWAVDGNAFPSSSSEFLVSAMADPGVYPVHLTIDNGTSVFSWERDVYVLTNRTISATNAVWHWGRFGGVRFPQTGDVEEDLGAFNAESIHDTGSVMNYHDSEGNLIFYGGRQYIETSDGVTIQNSTFRLWDAAHQEFTAGPGLADPYIYVNGGGEGAKIAFRHQDDPNRYTLYVARQGLRAMELELGPSGLNGVVLDKNVPITVGPPGAEVADDGSIKVAWMMNVMQHCDGETHWLLVLYPSQQIGVYHVSNGELTFSGSYPHGFDDDLSGIYVSPNGQRLLVGNQVFDFNRATGEPTFRGHIDYGVIEFARGATFSESGNILYFTGYGPLNLIQQYDLREPPPYVPKVVPNTAYIYTFKHGPDGYIYGDTWGSSDALSRFIYPETPVTENDPNASGFQHEVLELDFGGTGLYLPFSFHHVEAPEEAAFTITGNEDAPCGSFLFSPAGSCQPVVWDFGDGTSETAVGTVLHSFPPGTYTITATFGSGEMSQTIQVGLPEYSIAGNTTVCDGNATFYSLTEEASIISWEVIGGEFFESIPGEIEVFWLDSVGTVEALIQHPLHLNCSTSVSLSVSITSIPTPTLTGPVAPACGISVAYHNDVFGNGLEVNWLIQGGEIITAQDEGVEVVWTESIGTVVLDVFDPLSGCSKSVSLPVDPQDGILCSPIGLTITKSLVTDPVNLGQLMQFEITLTNTGDLDFAETAIYESYPQGFTVQSTSIAAEPESPDDPASDLFLTGPLAAGASVTLQVTGRIIDPALCGMVLENHVDGIGVHPDLPESISVHGVVRFHITCEPCLTLSKRASVDVSKPGEPLDFHLCLENCGTKNIPSIFLIDLLPSGFELGSVSMAPLSSSGSFYIWEITGLAPGEIFCITLKGKVASDADCEEDIENKAIAIVKFGASQWQVIPDSCLVTVVDCPGGGTPGGGDGFPGSDGGTPGNIGNAEMILDRPVDLGSSERQVKRSATRVIRQKAIISMTYQTYLDRLRLELWTIYQDTFGGSGKPPFQTSEWAMVGGKVLTEAAFLQKVQAISTKDPASTRIMK